MFSLGKLPQRLTQGFFAAAMLSVSAASLATEYPTRPISLITPFAAGGAVDGIIRAIVENASQTLKQPIVVEPKPGAGTRLGTLAIRDAKPDGYTLGVMVSASGVNIPALDASVAYDPLKDFTLLNIALEAGYVIAVNAGSNINTVADLIAAGKSKDQPLAYGSSGAGTSTHIWAEVFQAETGTHYMHVPYKGEGQTIADLAGGHLQFAFTSAALAKPLADAGKIRMIANGGFVPSSLFPDLPTLQSLGYPLNAGGWIAFVAPAGVPAEISEKVNAALLAALKSPSVAERTVAMGFNVVGAGPEAFAERLKSELATVRQVGEARGIKISTN